MDFFERIFHVSLDGGNGLLEAIYLALPLVAGGYWLRRRRRARRSER